MKYFGSTDMHHAIQFMEYHVDRPMRSISIPLRSVNMKDICDDWDANFVDSLDQNACFRLLMCANYLAINDLVALLSAKIASLMKGKSPKAIRSTFGIPDFNQNDLDEMRKSFPDLIEL
jgi:hypothetical protein